MAGGISLPTALQLLDGKPHKEVKSAIFENLPLAKVLSGGNISGLIQQVLAAGDMSPVLANPMASLTGGLQGLAGQAATQLQASLGSGASGLISALTGSSGLTTALTSLQAAGDNLVGLTNNQSGLFALAGHDSLLGMLGDTIPAAVAPSRVLGPTASSDLLTGISSALPGVVQNVISGGMSVAAATTWVQIQTASITGVVAASSDALAQGQAMQMQASTVATVAGLVTTPPGITPTTIQSALGGFVTPSARAAMTAALADQIAAESHDPIDVAAMTSLGGD